MSASPETEAVTQDTNVMSNATPEESEAEDAGPAQDDPQPKKRKGGRKPIYNTSEERKQRNRQAQAAFRERRTEYIKLLEVNIKGFEDEIKARRQAQSALEEDCRMLRYHNNMLERIIAEKGLDLHAELRARGVNPMLRPQQGPPASSGAPIMQQAIINRHQQAHPITPVSATQLEPNHPNSSMQQLHISSPTSATNAHTPSSSRISSPVTGYPGMHAQESRGAPPMSQHGPQSSHQDQHLMSQYPNYGGYLPLGPGQVQGGGPEAPSGPGGFPVYPGYHTPSSMEDAQASRHSSMAHSSFGKQPPGPNGSSI